MREIEFEKVVEAVEQICVEANLHLRDDVRRALEEAQKREEEPAKGYLELLLKNAEIAPRDRIPLCQDIGIPIFFVQIGRRVRLQGGTLQQALEEGVDRAFHKNPFRSLMLSDPLYPSEKQSDNPPPTLHIERLSGEGLRLICMMKGMGGENTSRMKMLSRREPLEAVRDFVVETVRLAGAQPCPPLVVGIGIGSTFERVGVLARQALLRPVGKPHPSLEYARLELELLEEINRLGIGPGGIGGKTTALAVLIEAAPCQQESLPVAVNLQCNSVRVGECVL